jgi:hypothetical protein
MLFIHLDFLILAGAALISNSVQFGQPIADYVKGIQESGSKIQTLFDYKNTAASGL